ncbi:MAG: hypothetical protein JST80_00155 [Bdellovibrionales bacterium]|nr:hypothetical protein [Bdellovibrionales bacterium]
MRVLSAIAIIILSGCSGVSNQDMGNLIGVSVTGNNQPTSTPTGITLNIVGGNNQTSAPGTTFTDPLRVQLLDDGVPQANKNVNFTVTNGMGISFSASGGVTDASGMVQTYVTASNAGNITIRASYLSYGADFSLSVTNQSNATLTKISGDSQTATVGTVLSQPLIVETRDSGTGSPLSNILVRFTVSGGNGRLNSASSSMTVASDGTGRASVNFEVGTLAGANTVVASIVSVPAQNTTFSSTGTVPTNSVINFAQSTVTAATGTLVADGSQTTTLTLTTRDVYGNTIPSGGKTVAFTVNTGTLLGSVNDLGNGTYTQIVRAPVAMPPNAISASGTVNGSALTSTAANISLLSGSISLTNSTITSAASSMVADGIATVLVTVTLKDSLGNQLSTGGQNVVLTSSMGTLIGSVTDVGNGTYTQTLKSSSSTGTAIVSATVGGSPLSTSKSIAFVAGPPDATKAVIVANPTSLPPNGSSASVITVQLRDANNNPCTNATGHTVTLTKSTGGTWMGSGTNVVAATDNADGTYSAILIAAATLGNSTITGTDNAAVLSKTATVYFTNGAYGPDVSNSTIQVIGSNPTAADGVSTVVVKVSLRDSFNSPILTGGSAVTITTNSGTLLGSVTDNGDGTYQQTLRAPSSAAIATVGASVDGNTLVRTANVSFYGSISLTTSTITAAPGSIVANGTSTTVLYLNAKDSNGTEIPVGGEATIVFGTTGGTLVGSVTDNGNGTYSQVLRSAASALTASVGATRSGVPFSNTVNVEFYTANNRAGLTIDCSNIATYQNTTLLVDNGTLTMNSTGSAGTCPSSFTFNGIILQNNAILTHTAATTTQEYGLELTANYITIDATSTIDVSAKGYPFSPTNNMIRTQGNTDVSSGASMQVGGSYGGQGASSSGAGTNVNLTYGSIFEPFDLGSSGGRYSTHQSGSGGGKVKLTVTGPSGILNSGSIKAEGGKVPNTQLSGAGSGGSIWINTTKLAGTGTINANGAGTNFDGTLRYAGSGGRIAIYYGDFSDLTNNFSYPTNALANITARGGIGVGSCAAGAGTVYLKSTAQTYGDLIIDNKGVATCTSTNGTIINQPAIPTNEAITATTLTRTNSFGDSYNTAASPYKGWYVDPNTTQNATPKKSDNSLFKITGATASVLTTTGGNMTSVATVADPAELVLVFDNFEQGDKTQISVGNLRILSYGGDLRSTDNITVTLTDALPPKGIEFVGAQNITFNLNSWTLPSFLNEDFGTASLTVSGGNFNFGTINARNFIASAANLFGTKLRIAGNVSLSSVNATFNQLKGNFAIQADGAIEFLNATTITQTATTSTVEHSLEIFGSSINLATGCTLSARGKGYPSVVATKNRVFGNVDATVSWTGAAATGAGGTHGGRGGAQGTTYYPAEVWGNYRDPYTSGGSGGTSNGSSGPGGGIIRISTSGAGPITISGTVDARATDVNADNGAGGSIYLNGGLVTGSGTLDARGGTNSGGMNYMGGGGGRIAVYYTSLGGNFTYPTNAIANIKAWGGTSNANTSYWAAAGTIFMKASSENYGRLIVNNNNSPLVDSSGRRTVINFPAIVSSSGLVYDSGTDTTTLTSVGTFNERYGPSNAYIGMYLNPNTAQNATTAIQDDALFPIIGQTANTLIAQGNATSVGTSGNIFQLNSKLDELRVIGKGILEINNGVILTNNLVVINGQIGGTGSVEVAQPSLSDLTLTPNGGTVRLNGLSNIGILNLLPGTYIVPSGGTISTNGNLTMSGATISGSNINYNVIGDFTATSSTLGTIGTITTTGDMNLTSTTGTANGNISIGGASVLSGATLAQTTGNFSVGTNLTVGPVSTLTQSQYNATLTVPGNFFITTNSSVTANYPTIAGNLSVDQVSTLSSGNAVLTPFTTYNTVSNLNVTGDTTVTNGSTIYSNVTNSTTEYYLYLTTTNLNIDNTSSISADNRGYRNVVYRTFRSLGNTDYLPMNSAGTGYLTTSETASAGAYGGAGGGAGGPHRSNRPYGSFYNPIYLGSSGSCWGASAGCPDAAGGAVRLKVPGTATINGIITAGGSQQSQSAGSGGSIYLDVGTLTGTGTGIIRANGPQTATVYGGGGGGRIAIYYNTFGGQYATPSTLISSLQAYGGNPSGTADARGSAGTIYLKASSQTYGDLIINNNGADSNLTTYFFPLGYATPTSSVVTSTTLTSPLGFYNLYGVLDFFKGYFLNPNVAQNATAKLSDDTVFSVTGNDNATLTTATTGMDSIASAGNTFALQLIFDNLEIRNRGKLNATAVNVRVLDGDLGSNNTTTFSQDGGLWGRTVDLGPGVTWSNTANASGTITTKCAANFPCP